MEENVNKAKNGDLVAYQELMNELMSYLYSIAISIVKTDENAADAIGNVVLKAYEKLHTLRNEQYFKTWLTRILINECKNIVRSKKKIVSLEDYTKEEAQEEKVVSQEEKMDLLEAINQLDGKMKSVILLFYYHDLKIDEIARILKIPEGTVKSRLNTGRAKLYSLLEEGRKQ